jgi:hypothetical protein
MQQTQAQQFAATYAADLAARMLRTIKLVRLAATAIMVIAMTVSYAHQAHYLQGLGAQLYAAWSIPGALDCLTFICVKVLGTTAVVSTARRTAGWVLSFPVVVSGAINFIAPGALIVKLVFVAVVLLIPAAEVVASRIKPDFNAMDTMERALATATVDEAERERRSAIALKAAATRRRNAARRPRRGKPVSAPVSPGYGPVSAPSAEEIATIAE